MIHVANPDLFRPVATYLRLIALARAQAPEAFEFRTSTYEFETTIPAFDLLTGSSAAREAMVTGTLPDDVAELVAPVDAAWVETVREAEARIERARF
jgi:uncharacterized protein YbbC (DUF1343 family)